MKLLLLLLLLTTTGVWGTPDPKEIDCLELYEVLSEAVEDGYIKEHEAQQMYDHCLTININN